MPRFSGYILKTKESRIIIEKLEWLSICTQRKKLNQAKNWKNQYGPFYKITRMYQCHRIQVLAGVLIYLKVSIRKYYHLIAQPFTNPG